MTEFICACGSREQIEKVFPGGLTLVEIMQRDFGWERAADAWLCWRCLKKSKPAALVDLSRALEFAELKRSPAEQPQSINEILDALAKSEGPEFPGA